MDAHKTAEDAFRLARLHLNAAKGSFAMGHLDTGLAVLREFALRYLGAAASALEIDAQMRSMLFELSEALSTIIAERASNSDHRTHVAFAPLDAAIACVADETLPPATRLRAAVEALARQEPFIEWEPLATGADGGR
jgi:hypothetical protein